MAWEGRNLLPVLPPCPSLEEEEEGWSWFAGLQLLLVEIRLQLAVLLITQCPRAQAWHPAVDLQQLLLGGCQLLMPPCRDLLGSAAQSPCEVCSSPSLGAREGKGFSGSWGCTGGVVPLLGSVGTAG